MKVNLNNDRYLDHFYGDLYGAKDPYAIHDVREDACWDLIDDTDIDSEETDDNE